MAMKKMIPFQGFCEVSAKVSAGSSSIQVSKNKPLTFCISSSKTTHFLMAISVLAHLYLSGFWKKINIS